LVGHTFGNRRHFIGADGFGGLGRRFRYSLCTCRRDRWRREETQFNIESRIAGIRHPFVAGGFNRPTLGHDYASLIDIHQSVTTFGYQLVTNRRRTGARYLSTIGRLHTYPDHVARDAGGQREMPRPHWHLVASFLSSNF